MNNKRFYVDIADNKDTWTLTVAQNGYSLLTMHFEKFLSWVPEKNRDDRFGLWNLQHIEIKASTSDEIAQATRLLNRLGKLADFGTWHLLPHELIKHGYKPYADRFPAKYA